MPSYHIHTRNDSLHLNRHESIILATHNQGKVLEISALLAPWGLVIHGAADKGLPSPEENGATFADNALIKAKSASMLSILPALADDSGLEVDALGGSPGIYSARWAKTSEGKQNFTMAIKKIHLLLGNLPSDQPISARFICALALWLPDGRHSVFHGKVEGCLSWPARGRYGFGYDPIFTPKNHNKTFAQMPLEQKHHLSHRTQAFTLFAKACLIN